MSKPRPSNNQPNLKGTLISVFTIGIFIFISWFSAYIFHLTR
ncbi:cytochrome C oxidase subunit II [Bacillus sp. AK128]